MRNKGKADQGFTLMEVLVAMMVFVTAFVILMGIYVGIASLRESSRNMIQATADARSVLEAMRDEAASGLTSVTAVDWTDWADTNGLTTLGEEEVSVDYVDAAADPLEVTVRIDWNERGRDRFTTISTQMTQR